MAQKNYYADFVFEPGGKVWFLTSYISHISDMADMEGGELEIIKMEKYNGMKALSEGSLKPEVVGACWDIGPI